MARGVNKAILIGNLGGDPELRKTTGGKDVTNFGLATNETWTDGEGQRQEHTEWHTIVVWGPMAKNCSQYLNKGSSVYVEGRIRTCKWKDKEDNDRTSKEIIADTVQFLDKKES